MSLYTTKLFYYAHFHALLRYGIIFWGGDNKRDTVCKLQKRVIRIIIGVVNIWLVDRYFKMTIFSQWLPYKYMK
jgi:hypothetical protein